MAVLRSSEYKLQLAVSGFCALKKQAKACTLNQTGDPDMDKEQLNKMLAQVRSELLNAESIDADRKKSLQKIAEEIQQALDNGGNKGGLNQLAARLKLEITQVEANHPSLTLSISELVDALAKIGV